MLDENLRLANILVVALLFGGMLFFSAGFAAFLFKHLPPADARLLIRKAFPLFYLFVIFSSAVALALSLGLNSSSSALLAFVMLTALAARQLLMPAINRATDLGLKKRFALLHGFSVILTMGHIAISGVVLVRMLN